MIAALIRWSVANRFLVLLAAAFVAAAGIWAVLLLLTVWQQVGIWRSAGKHQSRGGTAFWAGAAKFMVVLGVLGSASVFLTKGVPQINELTKLAFGDDPLRLVSTRSACCATVLNLRSLGR